MSAFTQLRLVNHFAALEQAYSSRVEPMPLTEPKMAHFNQALAAEIGLPAGAGDDPEVLAVMAGNAQLPGGKTVSAVYAGHQFGVYVPQLGDGRAMLLAQTQNEAGDLFELQLKGSGMTPYSRFADGRAVLRSSIREYLCSEAMHGLGVPTTRALSLVSSSDPVRRERMETAAVVCRVAPSFVRFGSFEYFYYGERFERLQPLADHVINHYFPHLREATDKYERWLAEVVDRTAALMAQWQSVGFCHGVMNTDNFSILGLTLDYGPFGFLDGFDSSHVCNHTDEGGRYAYEEQPKIGYWNCSRLLQATLPLLDLNPEKAVEKANDILARYPDQYAEGVLTLWCKKLGLREVRAGDRELANAFLNVLDAGKDDFTRSFRALAQIQRDNSRIPVLRDEIKNVEAFDAWLENYRARLQSDSEEDGERAARMNTVNPKFVLRNHLLQTAIEKAEAGDFSEIAHLFEVMQKPFEEHPEYSDYAAPAPDWAAQLSVSCSS